MINIRIANQFDADKIVSLMRRSFTANYLETIIYGCEGIQRFIIEQINIQKQLATTIYIVAEEHGEIKGFLELKKIDNSMIINQICTIKEDRNKGIGKEMLRKAISVAKEKKTDKIMLDVVSHNNIALSWYKKLGFIEDHLKTWWKIPLSPTTVEPVGDVSGYPQAKICQSAFGFSEFSLTTTTSHQKYYIGNLGEKFYRIAQPEILMDKEALSCLSSLDSKKIILGIFNKEIQSVDKSYIFLKSIRMSTDLYFFEKNLSNKS